MKDQIISLAVQILTPIVLALGGWATTELIKYIRAKTQSHVAKDLLGRIAIAADTVVNEMAQTVVTSMKAKTADGKLTAEDLKQVQADSMTKMKTYLGVNGLKLIAKNITTSDADVDKLLSANLEATLSRIKVVVK